MARARTRGEKLRRKRGRPKLDAAREPSGRISRSGIDHEPANLVAIDARCRHLNISKEQAMDQRAETYIGELAMKEKITEAQYQAIIQFVSLRNDFQRAIKAPFAGANNAVPGGSGDLVTDNYVDWAKGAIKHYNDAREAVQRVYDEPPKPALWQAFHTCVVANQRVSSFVGALGILGDTLAAHFGGLTRSRKSAN